MKLILFCCALWLLSPAASANSFCPSPLRVGFDHWPPYHYYDSATTDDKVLKGFAVETLNAMLTRLGCQVTYVERPW